MLIPLGPISQSPNYKCMENQGSKKIEVNYPTCVIRPI